MIVNSVLQRLSFVTDCYVPRKTVNTQWWWRLDLNGKRFEEFLFILKVSSFLLDNRSISLL